MKHISNFFLIANIIVTMPLYAQEMDHSSMHHDQHGASSSELGNHQSMPNENMSSDQHHDHTVTHDMTKPVLSSLPEATPALPRLNALPPSGKSREANFDNSYFMQSTALEQPLEVKCALASRGLIMLDNDSFQKCGGKPIGWSKGLTSAQTTEDHSQHMNH